MGDCQAFEVCTILQLFVELPNLLFDRGNILAVAISAPVLPELTQASASPALTSSIATRSEESFL